MKSDLWWHWSIRYNFLVADYQYSPPTLSYQSFDTWSAHLAAGLLHYSTSHASTVLLMATALLYNTDWCLSTRFVCCSYFQWQIQMGFHGFYGTPLLKGCLRKYYAQTYYVHNAHTGSTHFSFTVAITHVCHLIPVSRIRCMHGLRARIMSEASKRIKAKVLFMHCFLCS